MPTGPQPTRRMGCGGGRRKHRGCAPRGARFASRVSTGHVVMVLAGVLGVLFTLKRSRGAADHTRPMLAAARDIAPGTVLDSHSLRVVRVHVDDHVFATLFDAARARRDTRSGRGRAHARRRAGDSRTPCARTAAGDAPRAMSFPIPRSRAVGGALVVGDRVDVLERAPHQRAERLRRDRRAGARVLEPRERATAGLRRRQRHDRDRRRCRPRASRRRWRRERSRSCGRPVRRRCTKTRRSIPESAHAARSGSAKP